MMALATVSSSSSSRKKDESSAASSPWGPVTPSSSTKRKTLNVRASHKSLVRADTIGTATSSATATTYGDCDENDCNDDLSLGSCREYYEHLLTPTSPSSHATNSPTSCSTAATARLTPSPSSSPNKKKKQLTFALPPDENSINNKGNDNNRSEAPVLPSLAVVSTSAPGKNRSKEDADAHDETQRKRRGSFRHSIAATLQVLPGSCTALGSYYCSSLASIGPVESPTTHTESGEFACGKNDSNSGKEKGSSSMNLEVDTSVVGASAAAVEAAAASRCSSGGLHQQQPCCDVPSPSEEALLVSSEVPPARFGDDEPPPAGENVRVAVRLRPLETEKGPGSTVASKGKKKREKESDLLGWTVDESGKKLVQRDAGAAAAPSSYSSSSPRSPYFSKRGASSLFEFDAVFDGDVDTTDIYSKWVRPFVGAVMDGQHATVFTYGQTGSGKTYTMQGAVRGGGVGLIQLAANDLFQRIRGGTVSAPREYSVRVQYFEIYNEQIRDLLFDADSAYASVSGGGGGEAGGTGNLSKPRRLRFPGLRGKRRDPIVQVRDGLDGSPSVDAHEEVVEGAQDVLRLLEHGNKNRSIGATGRNEKSSRSHTVFRLTLESQPSAVDALAHDNNNPGAMRHSVLNLVDLAGSENGNNTVATGIRRREGGKINQSLLSLSKVIHSLSLPENKRPKHIGYRDSKLTRILQPHLSGNASMGVLCCISASRVHTEETRSTLKFAASASQVVMKPVVNEVIDQEQLLAKLQKELAETRATLMNLQSCVNLPQNASLVSTRKTRSVEIQTTAPAAESVLSPTDSSTTIVTEDSSPATSCVEIKPARIRPVHGAGASIVADGSPSEAAFAEDVPDPLPEPLVFRYAEDQLSLGAPMDEVFVMARSQLPPKERDEETVSRLAESEDRLKFLEEKLRATDKLVETLFRDLEYARDSNVQLAAFSADLERRLAEASPEGGGPEAAKAHRYTIALLKYTFYTAVAMYITGQTDFQLAAVLFMWLTLEGNT